MILLGPKTGKETRLTRLLNVSQFGSAKGALESAFHRDVRKLNLGRSNVENWASHRLRLESLIVNVMSIRRRTSFPDEWTIPGTDLLLQIWLGVLHPTATATTHWDQLPCIR